MLLFRSFKPYYWVLMVGSQIAKIWGNSWSTTKVGAKQKNKKNKKKTKTRKRFEHIVGMKRKHFVRHKIITFNTLT
jgi:hypothetical protein